MFGVQTRTNVYYHAQGFLMLHLHKVPLTPQHNVPAKLTLYGIQGLTCVSFNVLLIHYHLEALILSIISVFVFSTQNGTQSWISVNVNLEQCSTHRLKHVIIQSVEGLCQLESLEVRHLLGLWLSQGSRYSRRSKRRRKTKKMSKE